MQVFFAYFLSKKKVSADDRISTTSMLQVFFAYFLSKKEVSADDKISTNPIVASFLCLLSFEKESKSEGVYGAGDDAFWNRALIAVGAYAFFVFGFGFFDQFG